MATGKAERIETGSPDEGRLERCGETVEKIVRTLQYYVPSGLAILALLALWHYSVIWFELKQFILPPPASAVMVLFDPKYRWIENLLATLYAIAGAFVLSSVLGIGLAVVVVWHSMLERTMMPLMVLFNTLPKIALAPLFVIWLGYGIWPNIVIAVTVSFFPVVINTAAGLVAVDPELLDLVRTLRAKKWQVLLKIRFPAAMPYIFAGLKLNATLAVIGAIVGEFVASERGLGALIIAGGVTLDTPSIFAALTLIAFLGLALYALVVAFERVLMPWEFRESGQT